MKKRSRLTSFTVFSMSNESKVDHSRSARYPLSIWEPNLIESSSPSYANESHYQQLEELKRNARGLLTSSTDPAVLLNNIDAMQRLGVAYHFETEIKEALGGVHSFASTDLYTAGLQFRLLRENGFHVSSDILAKFRSRNGRFMDSLGQDTEALLSLYDASYLGMQEEEILEEAIDFSFQHLKFSVRKLDCTLFKKVQQSLEIPLHWRVPRLEAQSYIENYQISDSKNLTLFELAKLDYSLVQSVYHQELVELSRWWRKLGFKDKLSFARDNLMENYLWAVGIIFEPQYSKCRIGLAKFVCILTAMDDIFYAKGQPDELESFTAALNRWDVKEMGDIPEYMKICYFSLLNFANELVYDALKDHGLIISPYIEQEWVRLCRSYLLEEILEESNDISVRHLKSTVRKLDCSLFKKVQQSLEIPLHWRVPRFEAQSYIEHYQISNSKDLTFLEIAKLDYNLVQSVYQQELKELSRWWRKLGLKDRLSSARDNLMESSLWTVGVIFEPKYSKCRVGITKFVGILTAIDDIFYVYGKLDELESFTAALNRWDIEEMGDIPGYMKICYVALFNLVHELVYDALKDRGLIISPYIEQEWVRLADHTFLKHSGLSATMILQ